MFLNNACSDGEMCMNDGCVIEKDTPLDYQWAVEIEVRGGICIEFNTSSIINEISNVSGIEKNKLNATIEMKNNTGGNLVFTVYVNDKDDAELISQIVNECTEDGGKEECSGILHYAKNAVVVKRILESSSESSSEPSSESSSDSVTELHYLIVLTVMISLLIF